MKRQSPSSPLRFCFVLAAAVASGLGTGCAPRAAAVMTEVGHLQTTAIDEASGLACSRRTDDLLWLHNDSKGQPVLYAVNTRGESRGMVRLEAVRNVDWEDLDSFELDGSSWLLVADTGDNYRGRSNCVLHVVAEPDPAQLTATGTLTVPVAWSIPVRYPNAAHDCEAVAVDPGEGIVYLVTKREEVSSIFTVPLRPPADPRKLVATFVGRVPHIPRPTSQQQMLPVPTGRYRDQPTALDFSPDGKLAALLTYGDVLLFARKPGQSWHEALGGNPVLLPPHELNQAESLGFSRDGRALFVTDEAAGARLLRYSLEAER